ncbi:SufD family Fe-S cluster assembly protein [Methylicorpusculum oleiharenae]|uniref:SufB/SufD family protein n=1 Tax=Methylicorpusculum oleiharenae TaxID=1338687 RepID=UPI00135BF55B|nr:SufD family Fe-S cluster assembly protein [Methylicorpusculum oleiharenae]MCD2451690.1 SufD family Fe-S cluster assembly protein [Methylicorpusculum oleiharenae]
MQRLEQFFSLLNMAGIDSAVLNDRTKAHVVLDGQILLSHQEIPGVTMTIEDKHEVLTAEITIVRDNAVSNPIHLCFGLLQAIGRQRVSLHICVEPCAKVHFIAHGVFANADDVRHAMEKTIEVGEGADVYFTDSHIHGMSGNMKVISSGQVTVGKKARYRSDFSLTTGRVGRLDLKESIVADDYAIVELVSRVFGHGTDLININEAVSLNGQFSRSIIKSRVALEGQARADIVSMTEGRAEGARGHMDCMEIIKDTAVGQSTPIVKVSHPLAKITHEAAIGTVDKKQMETLICHGLSPEQATDMIVLGMLR